MNFKFEGSIDNVFEMIPSIASNYYLKILLDRIVTETYLYIIMNCFLVSLCVSGFVYH